MATIGYDSTTDLGGATRTTTDPHFIMNDTNTYTPSGAEELTEVGFHAEGSTLGTLEVGVYRTDTLAKIASANVTSTAAGRFVTAISGTLTAGVTYAVAWRVVSNVSLFLASVDPTVVGNRNTGLTGANALASTFTETGGDLKTRFGIFATTTASSSVTKTPTTGNLSLGGLVASHNAFRNVRIREVLINESGQPIASASNITLKVWYSGYCSGPANFSINGQTTDADGTTSWSISTGTLTKDAPIFYVAQDSLSFSNYTCARMIPSYE